MRKRISLIAGLTALVVMTSAHAGDVCLTDAPPQVVIVANPVNPDTGHTYRVYKANGITWQAAEDFVTHCLDEEGGEGIKPHLATITSSSENQWIVRDLLRPALEATTYGERLSQSQVWVGGKRDLAQGGWRWLSNENSEGRFFDVNGGQAYTNWAEAQGEPNNQGDGENWVTLGRYRDNPDDPNNPDPLLARWNDEGSAVGSIGGFIVEYDTPLLIGDCGGGPCTTVQGQTIEFPEGSFAPGDSIRFTAFEINDLRVDPITGKCLAGGEPLQLFKAEDGFPADSQLTIPAYLCGSPQLLVVKVDATDLTIEDGAVEVVNDTAVVLPDNLFECTGPKVTDPMAPRDPQKQDVVVWQSTDPSLMLETAGTGVYRGTATEATNACGSTRAKVRTGSYFVVGMHIDFGEEFDYRDFVDLTQYKLSLLQTSVSNAKSAGVLKNGDATKMTAQLNNAVKKLGRGDPSDALKHVNQFLKFVAAATYNSEQLPLNEKPYNYNGDHLMRGENIAFTLQDKVIPYRP